MMEPDEEGPDLASELKPAVVGYFLTMPSGFFRCRQPRNLTRAKRLVQAYLNQDPIMADSNPHSAPPAGGEKAHAALIARLAQLYRQPVRPPKSLQPTPEAAKSRIRRLRRKRQLLIKRSKAPLPAHD
jgi:hypothetical protein